MGTLFKGGYYLRKYDWFLITMLTLEEKGYSTARNLAMHCAKSTSWESSTQSQNANIKYLALI